MRPLIRTLLFPVALMVALGSTLALRTVGYSYFIAVFGTSLAIALPVMLLQRWYPYEESWRGKPTEFLLDALHAVLSNAVPTAFVRALVFGAVVAVSDWSIENLGGTVWPRWSPLWVQLPIALLVSDFFSYWAHRFCHTNALAWRIHALHHSAERMYVGVSVRNHPFNAILTYGAQTLPIALLGAGPEVLALHGVLNATIGVLQHSNLDMRTGPINWFFSTPELHRWHHSPVLEESQSNYGADLAIWDWVVGTRHLPADREPRAVGIPGVKVPLNYFQHLSVPLQLEKFEVAEEQRAAV
jgi:sterol desaturase/sphingolipid hydroxylase (fatty acid hydroxylase superfamily)